MTQDDIKAAREAEDAARKAVVSFRSEIEAEIHEAALAIRNRRQPALYALNDALRERTRERIAAEDVSPDHPWTGKRVFTMRRPRGMGWRTHYGDPVRIEGIVETYRSTTAMPSNTTSYRLPRIGEGFVRLLKADGSSGLKFERLDGNWKLAEEADEQR